MSERWTFQQEYVRCGKKSCKCCPHGPYWYSYQHVGGKMRKRYHGKHHPYAKQERPQAATAAPTDPRDAIFNKRTATPQLARQILGIGNHWTIADAKKRYRELVLQHHPDRGGDEHECRLVTAAWTFLESYIQDCY